MSQGKGFDQEVNIQTDFVIAFDLLCKVMLLILIAPTIPFSD